MLGKFKLLGSTIKCQTVQNIVEKIIGKTLIKATQKYISLC